MIKKIKNAIFWIVFILIMVFIIDTINKESQTYYQKLTTESIILWSISIIVFIIMIVGFYINSKYHDKLFRDLDENLKDYPKIPDYLYEIPPSKGPIYVTNGFFMEESSGLSFAAELADMQNKGIISLIPYQDERGLIFKRLENTYQIRANIDINKLPNHINPIEKHTIDFLFKKLTSPLTSKRITEFVEFEYMETINFLSKLEESAIRSFRKKGIYSNKKEKIDYDENTLKKVKRLRFIVVFAGIVFFIKFAYIILNIDNHIFYMAYLFIFDFLCILLITITSLFISFIPGSDYSLKGNYESQKRETLIHTMNNIEKLDYKEISKIKNWDEFLIYALAFGKIDKVKNIFIKNNSLKSKSSLYPYLDFYINLAEDFDKAKENAEHIRDTDT